MLGQRLLGNLDAAFAFSCPPHGGANCNTHATAAAGSCQLGGYGALELRACEGSGRLLAWAQSVPEVKVVERKGSFTLLATAPPYRGPLSQEEFDRMAEIAQHLVEDEVFNLQEVGAEKFRYLTGWARAVNARGQTLEVSLDDIYRRVRQSWELPPTPAHHGST